MDPQRTSNVVQAILFSADEPISVSDIVNLLRDEFDTEEACAKAVQDALVDLDRKLEDSSFELRHLASGIRLQIREAYVPWINQLWQRSPPKYSRALLETLAMIAYKQPVTRGDIEQIRGVQVRTTTIRTLMDRGWIREVGKRQSPGYPTLYGTTDTFLDYFNLQSIEELPPLSEIEGLTDIDELQFKTDKQPEHPPDRQPEQPDSLELEMLEPGEQTS
ncbi:MAG: SMC-Scp complex subunit ScpB [Gammaproteobacteria bacterium]|nr:SMC-Scp complex subunit ScpB [Gammaproteobacteria bacterium]